MKSYIKIGQLMFDVGFPAEGSGMKSARIDLRLYEFAGEFPLGSVYVYDMHTRRSRFLCPDHSRGFPHTGHVEEDKNYVVWRKVSEYGYEVAGSLCAACHTIVLLPEDSHAPLRIFELKESAEAIATG